MPGRSTTDAIHAIRQMSEKYRKKNKKLHMVFLDLEKAFDRIPTKLIWWALRHKKVPEKYIRIIQDMYMGHTTMVRSTTGTSAGFTIAEGVHQGSALSPLLFITVIDVLARSIPQTVPWNMIFADDIVILAESKDEMKERLVNWINILETHGLKVNREKTEYMVIGGDETESIDINDWQISAIESCKYLGSTIQTNGTIEKEIKSKINQGWLKWRSLSGVLFDKRIPHKLKGKIYSSIVQPTILYSSETWPTKESDEGSLQTMKMRMLRMIAGVTRKDKVRSTRILNSLKVVPIQTKLMVNRLRWYGHTMRRPMNYIGNKVESLEVMGKRKRGRPKLQWGHKVRANIKKYKIDKRDCMNNIKWRKRLKELTTRKGES
ncbi:unnamed protein product [Gordionus sp. m RMFG-2023]